LTARRRATNLARSKIYEEPIKEVPAILVSVPYAVTERIRAIQRILLFLACHARPCNELKCVYIR
jgi:hypothetical protein